MRIRQIKPSFWSDSSIASLSEATRLFYVGLWCIADDAGWLEGNLAEIALDLYGYEPRGQRERRVTTRLADLVKASRVVQHPCGHLEIPTLPAHQHLAASTKQVRTVFNRHLREPASARETPPKPGAGKDVDMVRSGTVSQGTSAQAHDDEERSEFRDRVPAPWTAKR